MTVKMRHKAVWFTSNYLFTSLQTNNMILKLSESSVTIVCREHLSSISVESCGIRLAVFCRYGITSIAINFPGKEVNVKYQIGSFN